MSSCIDSYHASALMERLLQAVLSNSSVEDIENILNNLRLMGADNIVPCMECAPCYDFIFYSQTIQKVFDGAISKESLKNELHVWRKTQLRDEALTNIKRGNSREDFNKRPFDASGTKVYFDQNVLSLYAQDEEIKSKIDHLKESGKFIFFYSPSNLEEINKIPYLDQKLLVVSALSELTGNIVILPDEKTNSFFIEDPCYGLKRIENHEGSTEALEELKLVSSRDRKMYLEKYDTAEHRQDIANNQSVFESLTDEEFGELVSLSHSSLYDKECFSNTTSRAEALHAVYTLSSMLDLLGYKVDTKEKTQKSSLHDIEHIIYGLDADIFVTNDRKLQSRAIQIYKFMNVDTKVVNLEGLLVINYN